MSIYVQRGIEKNVPLVFSDDLDVVYTTYDHNKIIKDDYIQTLKPESNSNAILISSDTFGTVYCDGTGDFTISSKGAIEGINYYTTRDNKQYVYSLIDRPAHTITFGGIYNNSDSSGPHESSATMKWGSVDIPAIQGDIIDCAVTVVKTGPYSATLKYDISTRSGSDVPNAEVEVAIHTKRSNSEALWVFHGMKCTTHGFHNTINLTKSEHGISMDPRTTDDLCEGYVSVRVTGNGVTTDRNKVFRFNINTPPTITPSSSSLGNIYSVPSLSYTIKDVDNDSVTVTESLNGLTKSTTVTSTASGAIVNSNIGAWFSSLANGSYTINATATDANGDSASTSVTFTKVDVPYDAPCLSPTSQDLGSSSTFISAGNWTIYRGDSKSLTYTEKLDNTILQSRTIYSTTTVSSAFTVDKWNALSYGTHTIKMYVVDNTKGGSYVGTKKITKVNAASTITSDVTTTLGEIHADPNITYTVTDPDSAFDIHEFVDDVEVTAYPDNPIGSSVTKVGILGYDKLTFDNHKFKVSVIDKVTNKTIEKTWTFTKGYNAPVISGSDGDYGTYSGTPNVTYTVYDPDNLTFSVTEYIDGNTTKTYTGLTAPHNASMSIDGWKLMENGKHTLKIVATNAGNISATRTWSITKDNKAPEISGNNLNLGNVNKVVQYEYTVSDPEGDTFTVIEKVDGSIIRTRSDLNGVQELVADLADMWANLAYNKEHVLNIVVTDAMSQTSTRTIAFTKVNVAPIAPSFVDLKTGMRRGNKENNFTFNVDIKPGIDYDGDTQYLSLEASTDSKFEENLVTFEPATYQKKAPDTDIWEECGSVSDADVRAGYIYRIPVSGLTENTDWYIRIISTDKNGSGASTKSSPIMISVGDILEIETYPKDCLNNRPIYALVEMNGTIDSQATVTMYICNNAYDATPVWEDCSEAYANSEAYTFKNSQKTAATWAIAVRVKVAANDATGPIAISNLCIAAKRQIS